MGQIPSHPFPRVWIWNTGTDLRGECSRDVRHRNIHSIPLKDLLGLWDVPHPSFGMAMNPSHRAGTGTVRLLQAAFRRLRPCRVYCRQFPVLHAGRGCYSNTWNGLGCSKGNALSFHTWPAGPGHCTLSLLPTNCLCWHLSHHLTELRNNETSENLQNNLQDKYTSCPNWVFNSPWSVT